MALTERFRLPASMAQRVPHGCHLMPDSIIEAQDYDEEYQAAGPRRSTNAPASGSSSAGSCDMDPDLEGRSRETVVKILADRMPSPPTGTPFELVEFDSLQVTPVRGYRPVPGPGPLQCPDGVLAARDRHEGRRPSALRDAA